MGKDFTDFILDYFKRFEGNDLHIRFALKYATGQYYKQYGKKPLIIPKTVDELCKEGKLTKVRPGFYKYDPDKNK